MKKCEDVEAAEREKAFFECDVSDPEAEVSWLRDGKVRLLRPSQGGYLFPCSPDMNWLKPQSHIHGFGHGRATVHPDLSNRGASA